VNLGHAFVKEELHLGSTGKIQSDLDALDLRQGKDAADQDQANRNRKTNPALSEEVDIRAGRDEFKGHRDLLK